MRFVLLALSRPFTIVVALIAIALGYLVLWLKLKS